MSTCAYDCMQFNACLHVKFNENGKYKGNKSEYKLQPCPYR